MAGGSDCTKQEARETAESNEALKLLIADTIERANGRLSQIERVRRFVIADEDFQLKKSINSNT